MTGIAGGGSKHFTLQEIAEGTYAAIASETGWAVGNAGIVDLSDVTVVFDTFANHLAAEDLRTAAQASTGRPAALVVNSHAHRDHVKGNQAFPKATIVATRRSTEAMTQNWRMRTERVRKEGLDPIRKAVEEEFAAWKSNAATTATDKVLWEAYRQAILEGIEDYDLKLPTVSFETSLRIHGSKSTAEAITFGGGHSASDALLYIPDQRVVFLGDLLFVGFQPFLGDGDPDEYLKILDRVEALDAKWLVPGHGPVGTSKDLQTMRDYVVAVQRAADAVQASGRGPHEAAARAVPAPFDSLRWRGFWQENLESLLRKATGAGGE